MSSPSHVHDQQLADQIAKASIGAFDTLPKKAKPQTRSNGVAEWTILACIVLAIPSAVLASDDRVNRPECVPISLGTGVKCLPASRVPPLGDALHDSHAEVLARRGFVRWLLNEAGTVIRGGQGLGVLQIDNYGFKLKAEVGVWLYISALPCGDASTLHTAAHQPPEMAQIKSTSTLSRPNTQGLIRGRNGYESFGNLRTKPGRADSQPAISLSCSDKIASWSVLGLTGGLLASPYRDGDGRGLFEPVYFSGVVVGGVETVPPQSEVVEALALCEGGWKEKIRNEVERALWGRLTGLENSLSGPYSLHKPTIYLTDVPFEYSKPTMSLTNPNTVPAVISALQISFPISSISLNNPGKRQQITEVITEVINNGTTQHGSWEPPGDVLVKEKIRSKVSKYELLREYLRLRRSMNELESSWPLPNVEATYHEMKHTPGSVYQAAKAILRGTPGHSEVDINDFVSGFETTKGSADGGETPFRGWIVSGERYESFAIVEQ